MLNDDLPQYIAAAADWKIYTKVDTNLSLRLTDDRLEALLLSGLSEVSASIDGFSQETYQRYWRGGRFELAFENLTRLATMRDRLGAETKIKWSFLVFAFNEHEVPMIAEFCARHSIEFVPRDAVVFQEQTDWLPAYRREGKRSPYRRSSAAAEWGSPSWITPAGVIPFYIGRPEGRSCAWHYAYTTVNADGGVLPCCGLFRKSGDFGEVTEAPGSFGQIWNNANFAAVRRSFPDEDAAPAAEPAAQCLQCTRSEMFRDNYAVLDREIVRKYWSLPESSEARWLDELYFLLQKSPAAFVDAYETRYREATALELTA